MSPILSRFIAALTAASAIMLAGCSSDKEKAPDNPVYHNVYVITPQLAGGSATSSYPATVEEARNISVGFKTAGQIKRLLVKEGDRVAQGQLLAVLDTVDYALGLRTLRVQRDQLAAEYERQKQLYAAGNMSPNDFDKATAGLRQVELNLKMNQNKLDYCRLYAPASGVITKRNFEVAEMVDAGTPVFELMDNSHLEAVVDLPVNAYVDRNSFRGFVGRSPHHPEITIPLTMLSLTPKADNSQLYRLRLVVGPNAAQLTPGQDLTVEIITDQDEAKGRTGVHAAAQVPLSSVLQRDGRSGVWRYNPADSTITFVPVTLSGSGENGTVTVTSGIEPGMTIVRAGVNHLSEGEKVNVIPDQSATNPGNLL